MHVKAFANRFHFMLIRLHRPHISNQSVENELIITHEATDEYNDFKALNSLPDIPIPFSLFHNLEILIMSYAFRKSINAVKGECVHTFSCFT